MRVIAGKARHLALKAPQGYDTRPTTDRIKETLFNMLQNEIYNVRFLDLFAGSGAIGIEALSRGATKAVFVEQSREACSIIKQNLEFTHLENQGEVICQNVLLALSRLRKEEPFDVVFMDPPYNKGLELQVLNSSDFINLLSEKALVIVEASIETDCSTFEISGLRFLKEKVYKTNKHIFMEKM